MKITFTVVAEPTGQSKEVVVSKRFGKYTGKYEVREISAQEGMEALNALILEDMELQSTPENIKPEELRKKQIEKATTVNGKPLIIKDLGEFPQKVWQILLAANEKLNSVSMEEARFLLEPSGNEREQSIQQ